MKQNMYAIEDIVTKSFNASFLAPNDESAIRIVKNAAAGGDTGFNQSPEDYRLHRVGTYSTETGKIIDTEKCPVHIINVAEIVKKQKGE